MSNPIFEALGINPKNFSIESSSVQVFEIDPEKPSKLDEGSIQSLYKLVSEDFIPDSDHIACSSLYLVRAKGNQIFVNSSEGLTVDSDITEARIHSQTLYILYKTTITLYSLPKMATTYSFDLTEEVYKSIKIDSLGKNFFLVGSKKILRFEERSKVLPIDFESDIACMDLIIDSNDEFCVLLDQKKIQVASYNNKLVSEYESDVKVDKICSINGYNIILYSSELFMILVYGYKKKSVLYSIAFNSKLVKNIKYCEETEQIILYNENSYKLIILSLDDYGVVSKYAVFGLKYPVKNMVHVVIENNIRHQPLYEGNSKHRFYVFHEKNIEIYSLDVISTKTVGFVYGTEPFPLEICDDLEFSRDDQSIGNGNALKNEPGLKHQPGLFVKSVIKEEKKEIFYEKHPEPKYNNENPAKYIKDIPKINELNLRPKENIQKIPETSIETICQSIKNEVSLEKISNIIVSATQSLKPGLKEAITCNTKSLISEVLSSPIQEISSKSLNPLEGSIKAGLVQINELQHELKDLLTKISSDMSIIPSVASSESRKTPSETLLDLIKLQDKSKIIQKLQSKAMDQALLLEIPEDDVIDLGILLAEVIEDGCTSVIDWLEMICNKITAKSNKFGELYLKLSNTSSVIFENSIKILEIKF
jgi:hypothetical protein